MRHWAASPTDPDFFQLVLSHSSSRAPQASAFVSMCRRKKGRRSNRRPFAASLQGSPRGKRPCVSAEARAGGRSRHLGSDAVTPFGIKPRKPAALSANAPNNIRRRRTDAHRRLLDLGCSCAEAAACCGDPSSPMHQAVSRNREEIGATPAEKSIRSHHHLKASVDRMPIDSGSGETGC
jgi:hypothetical protein